MLRSATYWISGSADRRVTMGGESFLVRALRVSSLSIRSMKCSTTLTAESTTAALACCSLGVTRSMMPSASLGSFVGYIASASRIATCPHSAHSLMAASILVLAPRESSNSPGPPEDSEISLMHAIAFDITVGFESEIISTKASRKPWSLTISGLMSCSLHTQIAAVFRTYGSSSLSAFDSGLAKYSVICSTRMHPMVRTASARISGFGSEASLTKVLTAMMARSGCDLA
mmetsp:Transcript_674/g.1636  ORF Transcript_674/g.1636 Transcript_674/m.1636 type:complete len:230 (-) Transcript_674:410-1099(-)